MKKTALFVASIVCASSLWTARAEDEAVKPAEGVAAVEPAVEPAVKPAVEPAEEAPKAPEAPATEVGVGKKHDKKADHPDKPGKPGKPEHPTGRQGKGPMGLAADTNGDGRISLEEFKVQHEAKMAARKEKLGDKFDPAKVPTAEDLFTKLDENGDGNLTKEEMMKAREPRVRPPKKADEAPAKTPVDVVTEKDEAGE